MSARLFVIENVLTRELWSNEFGWTKGTRYDEFTEHERDTLSPPMGGVWIQVPSHGGTP